jgi:autotransporter-associated beta strand protein
VGAKGGSGRVLAGGLLVAIAALIVAAGPAAAQDATWLLNPGSNVYTLGSNWSPAGVPTGTAFFGTSNTTSLTNVITQVGGWTFNPGASNYTFTVDVFILDFIGAGIVVNGGSATITNQAGLKFQNTSTAGSAAITNNVALEFFDTSTAGSATITNTGNIVFSNTSTAGSAAITNNLGGDLNFTDTSTAGSASITNNATLRFGVTSTAGSATITNTGTGTVEFSNSGTAGSATIANNLGGFLEFENTSTAGRATITNTGTVEFFDTSTAGSATIINNNVVSFINSSTAGGATITNNNDLEFQNSSTAGNAAIINNNFLEFIGTSTAGSAAITNGSAGVVDFSLSTGPNNDHKLSAGSIAGAGNFYLGADQLTVGGNNLSTTVSGVISDCGAGGTACQAHPATGGSLVKTGTGALTLSGANTYTGGTTLSAGTLVIGNNSALGAGGLSLAAGTTLSFLNTANFTIANPITISGDPFFTPPAGTTQTLSGVIADGSSPGVVEMSGAGTLALSGANTFTGGTIISSGTLQISGGGTLGASSAPLTVSGGTLNLGDTTQTTGALRMTSGTIENGSLNSLSFGLQAGTVSANLVGAGALTKTGTGTVLLSGTNSYTGATAINGGTLDIEGKLTATSAVTVNSGGTLAGGGTIDPLTVTVKAGATFAPGTPGTPGTSTTIVGNLALQSGTLYLVQINPAVASFANVSGTASLGGTVQANFAAGTYASRTTYDILKSTGLGGSTFSSLVTTNLPANYSGSLSYTATDVLLTINSVLGAGTSLNQNQQNVANGINNFVTNGGTLPPNFVNLFNLSGGGLANALTQLDGETATGSEIAAFQLMDQFLSLMLDPFVDGRLGSGGGYGGLSGRAIGFAPDEAENLPPEIALAYAGVLKAPPMTTFQQRWTAWGASYGGGNWTSGNATVGSSNINAQTYGFAAGMDYHYSPDTIVGFALGGGGTNWGLAGGGTGRSDAFQSGVYGITRNGPAYLGASLAFANHWMTTNRAAMGDSLTANFDAQSYGARVEGGYRYAVLPNLGVTPYAALQAQDFHTPGYSETDVTGGGFGLSYAAMNATDVRTELGGRFDSPQVIAGMPLLLRARLAWAHDWVSNPSMSAVFESLPGSNFVVNGAALPSDSALTSVGAELFITPRLTFLAKFDGEFAPTSQTYAGSGTLRYVW